MTERRAATTIGELDIHISNLQLSQAELARDFREALKSMATKADIESIRTDMAKLATKAELDAEVKAIEEKFGRATPASLFGKVVWFCGGAGVISAFVVLMLQLATWVHK